MEVPNLILTVDKGPKKGETLEKKPGTKVRIGRIVRGNNFTIKDDGISSNHLLIEVNDSSWVLSDLNTSNGTFLNGVQIEPNSPTTLKDGDFIKIGELTSIKVSFGEQTKKVVGKTKGLKSSGSGAVEVEVVGGGVPVRRYPRRGAAVVSKEQVVECTDVVSEVVTRGRRGRGRKNAALENETVEIVAEVNIGDDSKSAAEVAVSESLEVISGSNSKGKEVAESPEVEVGDSSIGNNSKEKEVVESPKVEVGDSSIGNNSKGKEVVESRKVRVGDSSKGNNSKGKEVAESPKVGDSSKGNHVACDDIPEISTNEEKMTLEKLNKMTLGEWFDYLEVYLVKQINKETDEIIDGMRAKAEEFKKFMSEQQKLKKKSPRAS